MIRIIALLIVSSIAKQLSAQQHNFIFNGGFGDGFVERKTQTVNNNSIFNGSYHDGFADDLFKQNSNNLSLQGGEDDGWDAQIFTTKNQNAILFGGLDDGWSSDRFNVKNQNTILHGGADDGWAISLLQAKTNHLVFNGGEGDGFDQSGISKMTWTGEESDEWLIAANWNPKIVPGKNDVACIPKVPTQYPLLKTGQLGIGTNGTYACEKLFVNAFAEVISQPGVDVRVYDLLELSGLFEFHKTGFNFIFVYEIGKLEIKNGGSLLMLEN